MFKRPIVILAALWAVVIAFLYLLFPSVFIPDVGFNEGDMVAAIGRVYKIEEKTKLKYFYLEDCSLDNENISRAVLYCDKELYQNVKIGYVIKADCTYKELSEAENYGNFDEKYYYNSLGIFAKAEINKLSVITSSVDYLSQFLYETQLSIVSAVYEETADTENAGIISAIIAGEKSGLGTDIKNLFQGNGISHILAVSGLHISIIGLSVFKLLKKLLGIKQGIVISSAVMVCFCILCGASVSALRATLMFLISMLAGYFGKSYDLKNSIALAAIILFIINPLYVINAAFWLSFGAVLSIAYINEILVKVMKPKNTLMEALYISISTTFGTLPVVVLNYYQIPVTGIILNLIVIPLMSFVLGSGLVSGLVGILSPLLGRFAIGGCTYVISFIKLLCRFFMRMPFGKLVVGNVSAWQVFAYYLILFLALFAAANRHKIKSLLRTLLDNLENNKKTGDFVYRIKCSELIKENIFLKLSSRLKGKKYIAMILCLVILAITLAVNFKPSGLAIYFLDVDQGDCILIESPAHTIYMIDGGSSSMEEVNEYRISGALKYLGITEIDYSIITHPDSDHVSGILEILEDMGTENESIGIKNIYIPKVEGNKNYEKIQKLAAEKNVGFYNIHTGIKFSEGSLQIKCLHPSFDYVGEDVNNYSTVLDLEFNGFRALLTGDVETDGESILMSENLLAESYDLLKVAHHGSAGTSSAEFLNRVSPKLAIISAGEGNRYGHPHQETLDRLKCVGAQIFCTAETGEIIVNVSENGRVNVKTKLKKQSDD